MQTRKLEDPTPGGNSDSHSAPPAPSSEAAAPLSPFILPCRHLRSKEMYYQAYGQADDQFSSGIYWCGKTQENFGPDGECCGQAECAPGRPCYLV